MQLDRERDSRTCRAPLRRSRAHSTSPSEAAPQSESTCLCGISG